MRLREVWKEKAKQQRTGGIVGFHKEEKSVAMRIERKSGKSEEQFDRRHTGVGRRGTVRGRGGQRCEPIARLTLVKVEMERV